jgi:nicotinamidase-related amidase
MATRRNQLKYKTRRGKKVLRRNKRTMLRKKNRRMTRRYRGGDAIMIDDKYENVLLIIDPQNDFSDKNPNVGREADGNLAVPGSSGDYERIIAFINANQTKLAEIHVSLDTHTERHIGNPGFWTRVDETGDIVSEICDDSDGLRILSVVKKDDKIIYQGLSVIEIGKCGIDAAAHQYLTGGEQIRYYVPRNYGGNYQQLCSYVKDYINFYSTPQSKHGQLPWIWRKHCIEGSEGHKVVSELQTIFDSTENIPNDPNGREFRDKVSYHIKGQNNLAEMYSIFSAEMPVTVTGLDDYMNTSKYKNKQQNNVNKYDTTEGIRDYADFDCAGSNKADCGYLNLETKRNTGMMDKLLGLDTGKPRRIFICGQAKTHCVKSSLIDLMEYATEKSVVADRIVLLSNMTSPICGALDDIVKKTKEMKYTVL